MDTYTIRERGRRKLAIFPYRKVNYTHVFVTLGPLQVSFAVNARDTHAGGANTVVQVGRRATLVLPRRFDQYGEWCPYLRVEREES
jgi:hypothetical protein